MPCLDPKVAAGNMRHNFTCALAQGPCDKCYGMIQASFFSIKADTLSLFRRKSLPTLCLACFDQPPDRRECSIALYEGTPVDPRTGSRHCHLGQRAPHSRNPSLGPVDASGHTQRLRLPAISSQRRLSATGEHANSNSHSDADRCAD